MKQLSLKKQMLFTLTLVGLLLVVILLFIVLPRANSILEIRRTILERQTEVERQHSQSKKLRTTLVELNKSLEISRVITQATVNTGQELQIIQKLETLAANYGIEQNLSVAVKDVEKEKPLHRQGVKKYYELTFVNHGTYEKHIGYLQALEKLPYYVIVESLDWSVNTSKQTDETITLKFSGKIYIYSQ